MLARITRLLADHGALSAGQLAQLLHSDPGAVAGMLASLERMGRVQPFQSERCDGCSACAVPTEPRYRLSESASSPRSAASRCASKSGG
jgi:hypothetical protein